MYILTIDLGTTNLKVFLWNKEGKIIFRKIFPTPFNEDYSISPFILKNYLEAIFDSLEKKRKKLIGIVISGMGEAGLLIDSKGNPLTNIFSWLDSRGEKEIKILENIGKDKIFEITGLKISSKYSLAKILWVRENLKDVWKKRYKWLNAVDYLNYLLTGKILTDYTLANRMLLFDIKKRNWSLEILNLCNLDLSILPEIQPAGRIIGEILPYWKEKYSLPDTPVILGGHDHPIGSLSFSLSDKILLDSWGTAEALFLSTFFPLLNKELGKKGFSIGYIFEEKYYLIAGIHYSGGIKNWIKKNLKWNIPKNFDKPTNIFFFPYILGRNIPSPNPNVKGMFYGIDINTKISDFKKAIWEGIFYETKIIIEELKSLGFPIEKIIVFGGMTRYKNLLELKRDILNIPLLISKEREITSKGSAYLVVKNLLPKEIYNNFTNNEFNELHPSSKSKLYQEKFQTYKELTSKIFQVNF
ncbi:MAG: FGGY family carbohydrate kinase [Dictyoglomaceae bacterium]|nr:FGGY family carbohydrate kinase [Dictyoglomaceae bacterium]